MVLDPRRAGLLTASDFGAACGFNPYKSRQRLWRLKTGREVFEGNDRTQYGNDNEGMAIAHYEAVTGNLVAPGAFSTNPRYPALGATPDGHVEGSGLLEAKCPVSGLYKDIPVYYLAQVVGQMEICERESCDFIAWTPEKSKIWTVDRSSEGWQTILPFLEQMVHYIRTDKEPPRWGRKNPKPDPDDFRALVGYQLIED